MIRFLFDYISPYSYLAWTRVHDVAARVSREVEPVPVLFAALLDAWGQKGPAEIAPKREYIFKEVLRRAHDLGLRVTPPPSHPFNPLPALRATCAITDPGEKKRAIDALYRATWGGGEGVDGEARVALVLSDAGLDGESIVRAARTAEVKEQLREGTERARASGAFGVPTMIVDGELFWGDDSFAHLERFARGDDPIDRVALERWRTLSASAVRPGSRPA